MGFWKKAKLPMIRRCVADGAFIPFGYGIAWSDLVRNRAVCYPIPLNRLVGWAYNFYWFKLVNPQDAVLHRDQKSFEAGFQQAMLAVDDERERAYNEGYAAGRKEAGQTIDEAYTEWLAERRSN